MTPAPSATPSIPGPLAWGRLLRLSMAPSAAADIAAGAVLAAGRWPAGAAPFLLMAGSICVYCGGLALNDWRDREHDAATRPARPLPSGAVAPGGALALAVALLVLGPLLALGAGPLPAAILFGVALLAVAYDLWGRGPLLGPLLLGLCRAGNLGAGLALGQALNSSSTPALLAAPALYGAYVFVLSRLGRYEDAEEGREPGRRPSIYLGLAAVLLLAAPFVPGPAHAVAHLASVALALLAAVPLVRTALGTRTWERGSVERAMGLGLRRLLALTAVLVLKVPGAAGLITGGAILLGYAVSHALRRVFPPS